MKLCASQKLLRFVFDERHQHKDGKLKALTSSENKDYYLIVDKINFFNVCFTFKNNHYAFFMSNF